MLDITIPPTFLQGWPFKLLCAAGAFLLLVVAYSIRTRQLSARVRERVEAQLSERESIARELHDTLLQGFQGLVLSFQSVGNRMSGDDALLPPMDRALARAEAVLTEGRERVGKLRFAFEGPELEAVAGRCWTSFCASQTQNLAFQWMLDASGTTGLASGGDGGIRFFLLGYCFC